MASMATKILRPRLASPRASAVSTRRLSHESFSRLSLLIALWLAWLACDGGNIGRYRAGRCSPSVAALSDDKAVADDT